MSESLFSDFSPVSTEDWWEKIRGDLKGKDPARLIRKNPDGIPVKPFYRKEDLPAGGTDHGIERGTGKSWAIQLNFEGESPEVWKDALSDEVLEGVDALSVSVGSLQPDEHAILTSKIAGALEGGKRALHLDVAADAADAWLSWLSQSGASPLSGSLNTHIMEGFIPHFSAAGQWMKDTQAHSEFRVLGIDGQATYEASGSDVEELAIVLAQAVEILHGLTERGNTAEAIFQNLHIQMSCGPDFMGGIAKFRAFRVVLAQLAQAYAVQLTPENFPPIKAITSRRSYTWLDPQVNMLRGTTAALAAVLGGADSIAVRPWDEFEGTYSASTTRIARNVLLLLKHESYLDWVTDPVGGAWYLESLTDSLAKAVWKRFQEIEAQGGYLAIRSDLTYSDALSAVAKKMASRRQVRIGVNQFPNATDGAKPALSEAWNFPRPDVVYEGIRDRGMAYEEAAIFLFTFGKPAFRTARSGFAANLIGLTGLPLVENKTPNDPDQAIAQMVATQPGIVVFCSDNDSWPTAPIEQIRTALPDAQLILAGKPEDPEVYTKRGMDHIIYAGMDAPSFLNEVLDQLKGGKS